MLLMVTGCSAESSASSADNKAVWTDFSVSCHISVVTAIKNWWYGKQTMQMDTPCKKLVTRSVHRAYPKQKKGVRDASSSQVFKQIAVGRFKNWSWDVSAQAPVAQSWATRRTKRQLKLDNTGQGSGPRVSWPRLFRDAHSIYRYVLATQPPKTHFSLHLLPGGQPFDRTVASPARKDITLAFFIPYFPQGENWSSHLHLDGWQTAYYAASFTVSFEYMHALFFVKKIEVPNLLTSSVAGSIILDVLPLVYWRRCPRFSLTFPSTKAALSRVRREKSSLLRKGKVDPYAGLLAAANIAHVLGNDSGEVTIHAGDHVSILRLLKLARAMLQKPVDFTKRKLYPLKRLDSIPNYKGMQDFMRSNRSFSGCRTSS